MTVTTHTKIFATLSAPPSTVGAVLYNSLFRRNGIDALFLPLACKDSVKAVAGADALGLTGLTVSMPYKQVVMSSLDRVDEAAEAIGAVNTVVLAEGRRIGFNTDWYGAVKALEELTPIAGRKVLVIGAGGGAKAISYGIRLREGELFIANRTGEKAEELAAVTHSTRLDYEDAFRAVPEMDIVINATSVGFMGSNHDKRLERTEFSSRHTVLDIVFAPVETRFLFAAKQQGAAVIPGYKMLIHQALMQCRHWLEVSIEDYSATEQELLKCCDRPLEKGAYDTPDRAETA